MYPHNFVPVQNHHRFTTRWERRVEGNCGDGRDYHVRRGSPRTYAITGEKSSGEWAGVPNGVSTSIPHHQKIRSALKLKGGEKQRRNLNRLLYVECRASRLSSVNALRPDEKEQKAGIK